MQTLNFTQTNLEIETLNETELETVIGGMQDETLDAINDYLTDFYS